MIIDYYTMVDSDRSLGMEFSLLPVAGGMVKKKGITWKRKTLLIECLDRDGEHQSSRGPG